MELRVSFARILCVHPTKVFIALLCRRQEVCNRGIALHKVFIAWLCERSTQEESTYAQDARWYGSQVTGALRAKQ